MGIRHNDQCLQARSGGLYPHEVNLAKRTGQNGFSYG